MTIFLVLYCCLEVEVAGMIVFCLWGEKKLLRDHWSFSLMGFWWCFQGERNNLLLISTLRPCQCDLTFIFSQKLHWFSALIFFHLYLTWIQKCVNDTGIAFPVLTCWKFSSHWEYASKHMHSHSKSNRPQLICVIKTDLWEAGLIVQNEHIFLETKLSSTTKGLIAL